ncbi:MAG: hypothetical protein A3G34_08555 [Candidatus Lindowbacteria bacterium RIFCSPLOWO2_12_FULL_62_27]|nr:MAG: hypothetical protein A3G34_08555 [Candidatus Lindowbacteria bacterium RIFCSPLOWO2_12_FULL_62_27]
MQEMNAAGAVNREMIEPDLEWNILCSGFVQMKTAPDLARPHGQDAMIRPHPPDGGAEENQEHRRMSHKNSRTRPDGPDAHEGTGGEVDGERGKEKIEPRGGKEPVEAETENESRSCGAQHFWIDLRRLALRNRCADDAGQNDQAQEPEEQPDGSQFRKDRIHEPTYCKSCSGQSGEGREMRNLSECRWMAFRADGGDRPGM